MVNRAAIEQLTRQTLEKLMVLLESSEQDQFASHRYQSRKEYRLVCQRVAPIFGPRYVAKLARSTAACGEMGTPQPHQVCARLLAIFRKLTAT